MDKKIIRCEKRNNGKFLLISALFIVLCIPAAGFAGCGKQEEHTHAFTEQNVKQIYLAEEATCTQAAKYYYSCACGEKGTQTFEIGNALGHNFGEWQTVNGKKRRKCTRNGCDYFETEDIQREASKGLEYSVNYETGNCAVTGIGTCTDADIVIPEITEDGYKVTSIGGGAFIDCEEITSIVIPDGVTSIGRRAFYKCSNLKSITIGKGMSDIYLEAFDYCDLENIYITDMVAWCKISGTRNLMNTGILFTGKNLYLNNELVTDLVIPDDLTSINEYAFYKISSITRVTIPNSVTTIGGCAFYYCSGLTSIELSDSVTSISSSAFEFCKGLTNITVDKNNKKYHSEGNCLIETETKTLVLGGKNCIIPSDGSVTSIGREAFYGREQLNNIVIPEGVTSIESNAFWFCTALTSITIPDSITHIADAFYLCINLKYNEYGNCLYLGNDKNPYLCLKSSTIYATSYTINERCKVIYPSAFEYCRELTSIVIPDSVADIGTYAFRDCSGLTSITIGSSVSSIGIYAFYDCSGLTSIVIPDSVTSIDDSAFYNCSGLTSVTVGRSLESIGVRVFSGCSRLESISVSPNNEKYHSNGNCLIETKSKTLIFGCKNSIIPADGSVTSIGDYAFYNCRGLTSIVIPDSVTSIGKSAFGYCSGLTSVTIGSSVSSIGEWVFEDCKGLTEIHYDGTIKQWKTIRKGNMWDRDTGNYTVYCTDGDLTKKQA